MALIAAVRALLHSAAFVDCHRTRPQAFSRWRELIFARVILLLLQKGVKSVQGRLNEFYARLQDLAWEELQEQERARAGQDWPLVSKSAWTQARAKLSHRAFIALNQEAVLAQAYAPEYAPLLARWRGHRLLAIDGSLLRLPGKAALGAHFGWSESGNEKGACGPRHVQARASVCFDVLNRLVLDARLEPFATGERALAALHAAAAMQAGDVALLDRGYCGVENFLALRASGADFICRVPRNWIPASRALFAADEPGRSVLVDLPGGGKSGGGGGRRVRLVSVRLSTGELEVLATSLLDETLYPSEGFGEVYHLRWGVESFYLVLKSRLEVERFSGETLEAVRQDFFSSVFLTNVESLLSGPAQAQLSAGDGQRKQALQVNRAQSFGALKSHVLELFGSRLPEREVLARLTRLMRAAPVARRPGRQVPRHPPSSRRAADYWRYQRKHVF